MSNKRVELFITLITAASVVVILLQYVYPLNSFQMLVVYMFDFIVAIILAVDFYFRMKSSKNGYLRFFLRHWYEIPAMIPLFTFAWLESQNITGAGLRALRLIRLLRLVQLSCRTLRIFEETSYLYFAAFSTMAVILAAFGVVESHAENSTIRNLGDAFWRDFSTITTASYADVYPVTIEGKAIAVVIMFVGLAILGVFISTLGATIIERRLQRPQPRLLAEDTKILMKYKIDGIGNLTQNDFEDLMLSIRNLRDMEVRKQKK